MAVMTAKAGVHIDRTSCLPAFAGISMQGGLLVSEVEIHRVYAWRVVVPVRKKRPAT